MFRFHYNDIFFTAFFLLFLIIAAIERIRATFRNKCPIRDKKWATIIPIATYISIVMLGVVEYLFVDRQINYFISFMGLAIYINGAALRKSAIRTFKENWNIHINADSVNCIVDHGPYKYLRHPYSIAVILELVGFLLLANSYFMLIFVFLIQYPLLLIRNNIEENNLIREFGEKYISYRKRTKTLFPNLKII
jgi:protein-S-isoprenylcysteine O-methyltransferase Ste14